MNDIKLGSMIEDLATGFRGIASQRLENMNGSIQYAIQPKSETGNTYPEAMFIDVHMLTVVGDGVSDKAFPAPIPKVCLGKKVVCSVTGVQGIATHMATYMNGCIAFCVTHKNSDGDAVESWIDHNRLSEVGKGVSVQQPANKDGARPGGPAKRVMNKFI